MTNEFNCRRFLSLPPPNPQSQWRRTHADRGPRFLLAPASVYTGAKAAARTARPGQGAVLAPQGPHAQPASGRDKRRLPSSSPHSAGLRSRSPVPTASPPSSLVSPASSHLGPSPPPLGTTTRSADAARASSRASPPPRPARTNQRPALRLACPPSSAVSQSLGGAALNRAVPLRADAQ